MTIKIKVATDMHTLEFDPDLFSLPHNVLEYLGEVLYRTGEYILGLEDVHYEFKK